MAFSETNKEPANNAEEQEPTLEPRHSDTSLVHDPDPSLSDTHTTFSELTGRSLKVAGLEEILATTLSKDRDYQPKNQPARIGDRYKIDELIGVGGMGAVYRGKHEAMGKTLAIKVLHEDAVANKKAVLRFDQEARAASALTHPHLVSVYDYGVTDDGAPYLVMDYLEGSSLSAMIKEEGPLKPTRALNIFIQMVEGIAHAHKKGVIHRDLKPSNVIITKTDRDEDFVKIVDFGIAKMIVADLSAEENSLTQTGEIFGSPLYMSPEQCTGRPLDQRSDIYSLGCLMYETLTGAPPFQGNNPVQTIMMHIHDQPPRILAARTQGPLPEGLESVIMRALNKSADDRYASAETLLSDLEKVRDGVKILHRGTIKRLARAFAPKDRRGMLIRAAVFGLLLSMPLAAGCFFYERLFPDEIKTLVEKGDQSMKDPVGGDTAEMCFKQAIALGLHDKIEPDRQAMLDDRLAYYYLRQARVYQATQANQAKEKQVLAQGISSKQFSRAINQYKIALREAQRSQNPLRIATENLGVADSLRADSNPKLAAPYYQECVNWAKSAHGAGDDILGAALLGQAANLHTMSCYRDAITAALKAAAVYNLPGSTHQLNRVSAYEVAADSATASAAAFALDGNTPGATKLYEEADQFYDLATKTLSQAKFANDSPEVTSIKMLRVQMLKQKQTMLTEHGQKAEAALVEKQRQEILSTVTEK